MCVICMHFAASKPDNSIDILQKSDISGKVNSAALSNHFTSKENHLFLGMSTNAAATA